MVWGWYKIVTRGDNQQRVTVTLADRNYFSSAEEARKHARTHLDPCLWHRYEISNRYGTVLSPVADVIN